jgi:NAD+ kinase
MSKSKYQRVGIVAKPHAENLENTLSDILDLLTERGCQVILDDQIASKSHFPSADRGELVKNSDMVIVLGGDGTMLSLAKFQDEEEKPVLGINMGSLGFITDVVVEDAVKKVAEALDGKLMISKRMMLNAELIRDGKALPLSNVLNDVVISKSTLARIFDVQVSVDGEPVTSIRADGIIVSTPTGSTAYNLSADGPIVHPEMDVVILTPICPHTLTYRPVVLSADSVLELNLLNSEETFLTLDGQSGFPLQQGDIVKISRSERMMSIFWAHPQSFFEVLSNKLNWGGTASMTRQV